MPRELDPTAVAQAIDDLQLQLVATQELLALALKRLFGPDADTALSEVVGHIVSRAPSPTDENAARRNEGKRAITRAQRAIKVLALGGVHAVLPPGTASR